ncbi:Hypothetical protein PFR_JS12-1_1912 [Propionibacterium freudenreichii]|nr:Hypothetical protein PFR_JS12-2_1911 [Propionibacterium freudenreichii]SCC97880.1 Hypothetical protein PFR_JS12-1_1912 [Propionibacterium freudenreichii]
MLALVPVLQPDLAASMKGPSRRRGNGGHVEQGCDFHEGLNEGPLQKEGQWRAWEQGSH